eukprot:Skav203472  [mRNA]  locus=scaffold921:51513:53147:+ [translate_table: standard]
MAVLRRNCHWHAKGGGRARLDQSPAAFLRLSSWRSRRAEPAAAERSDAKWATKLLGAAVLRDGVAMGCPNWWWAWLSGGHLSGRAWWKILEDPVPTKRDQSNPLEQQR